MYSFCKWYESVFERHAISCIVFCAISFLILLFLFLIPSGEVFASENNGSSASTSVIIGGDGSGSSNWWDIIYDTEESLVYHKDNLNFYSLNESYFTSNNLKAIKLSDMIEVTGFNENNNSVPHYYTCFRGQNNFTIDDINRMLDNLYLIDADRFYEYSSYNFLIDTSESDYLQTI